MRWRSRQHRIRLTRLLVSAVAASMAGVTGTSAAAPAPVDWGRAVVDSTISPQRFPDAARLPWGYQWALYLYGQYLVYRRTHDPRYLAYIGRWGDAHVRADGTVVDGGKPVDFWALDLVNPGRMVAILYAETKEERYRLAARTIRARLDDWPRTRDGGFWHTRRSTGQLWADGAYMSAAFLLAYAGIVGDRGVSTNEAARQLLVYGRHLQSGTSGLIHHAYSETRAAPWANRVTGRSPEIWCRANGWYAVALTSLLDVLPDTHPSRPELGRILAKLTAGIEAHQDPTTRRWFEVVDKGRLAGNWVETSCSAMHSYVLARAVARGRLPSSHLSVARDGFQGVLKMASIDAAGRANLSGTVIGTSVGDLAYYLGRPRSTNNPHGLGAFLIMHEQLAPLR